MTAEQIADVVMTAVKVATTPLVERMVVLEAKALIVGPQGEPGKDGDKGELGKTGLPGEPGPAGQDADPAVVLALKNDVSALRSELLQTKSLDVTPSMVTQMVADALAALPTPQDGKDGLDGKDGTSVDLVAVDALIRQKVEKAASAMPIPKDGHSVTVDDVTPVIQGLIEKAFSTITPPKDGLGITSAVVDRAGHLILTMTDGAEKDLGEVVGQHGRDGLPGIGRPGADGKDGADGLSFDDIDEELQDGGRLLIRRYRRGERVKEFRHITSTEIYRGVYVDGKTYDRGDSVTWGGSEWHGNETTNAKPGDGSKAWTLKVKRGRDGKDAKDVTGVSAPFPVVSVGKR